MATHLFTSLFVALTVMAGSLQAGDTAGRSNMTTWQASDVPNPQTNPGGCGVAYLTRPGYVCDPNLLVTNYTVLGMGRIISMTYDKTGGVCEEGGDKGYRIAVALLHDISNTDGLSVKQQRTVADKFAKTLSEDSWRFGTCGNDVTIVVSSIGNTIGVSVGDKAAELLPPEKMKEITDEAISKLNKQTIGVETLWHLSKIHDLLTGSAERWDKYRIFILSLAGILFAALTMLAIYLIAYLIVYISTSQRKRRAKRAMKKKNIYDPEYGRQRSRSGKH